MAALPASPAAASSLGGAAPMPRVLSLGVVEDGKDGISDASH